MFYSKIETFTQWPCPVLSVAMCLELMGEDRLDFDFDAASLFFARQV